MSKKMSKEMEATLARMLSNLESKVAPSHTALIVVDMQNDFCADGGAMAKEGFDLTMVQAMAPRLASFISESRKVGLTIIYIQNIYNTEDNRYLSDVWLEQAKRKRKGSYIQHPVCERDSWGADFYDGVKPLPKEIVVNKHRFNAFMDTDLDLILRSKGIRTLIMTGATTNVCVESTARDGFMRDYYIVLLKDCTAAYYEEAHKSALNNIEFSFGQVLNSNDVLNCWRLS